MSTIEQIFFEKIKPEESTHIVDVDKYEQTFRDLNSLMNNPAFRDLGPNVTFFQKIKIFIKRVIRKLTKFYVEPLALQQIIICVIIN